MFSKKLSKTGWPLVGAAALISTLLSGNVAAKEVTVAIHVSTQGLDLSQASDARTFYLRMKDAAWIACTRADRVNLEPVDNVQLCVEKALGGAVRSARAPMVTQVYLETHTLREADNYGIEVAPKLASK